MAKRKIKSFDLFSGYSWYVPGTGGMFMLLAMFLLGAIIGNCVAAIMAIVSQEAFQTYGMLVSYPVMFIPPMLYASFQSRKNAFFETGYAVDSSNFGKFSTASIALAVSIATLALAFLMDGVSSLMPPMPESLEAVFKNLMDGPLWVTLISVSIFAPFFEEWLCRGMILRGLLQKMKPVWAIVISALFFAVIHMNPWQAIPAFALGVLFGYVYYRTGSLKLTILMHCVNNTFAAIMGHVDAFKDADSFREVLSPVNYICLLVLCALMTAYFVIRMKKGVEIPFGQKNGCEVLRNDDGFGSDPANM
ncbi:MAG: CPBP family intramembrane metalloprotease [Clostridium sp.]|nr:CPBP family intramembrane metalloprotease [Bacteroides sp.]MCM1197787.1 CPBP family intramembrane metalloprotease [Clostridium sp.]